MLVAILIVMGSRVFYRIFLFAKQLEGKIGLFLKIKIAFFLVVYSYFLPFAVPLSCSLLFQSSAFNVTGLRTR